MTETPRRRFPRSGPNTKSGPCGEPRSGQEFRDSELPLRHAVRLTEAAGRLEEIVFCAGPALDRSLQQYQRAHRNMGRTDRLVLGSAVYGLARNRSLYRRALPSASPGDGMLLLLALLDSQNAEAPGTVPHLPGGVSPWREALDKVRTLRADWTQKLGIAPEKSPSELDPELEEAFAGLFSLPPWWLREGPWKHLHEAVSELSVLKSPQRLVLRVQAHHPGRDAIVSSLGELGIPATPTLRSPWGIRIEGRHNVLATDLFRTGRIEVQDEGSQLVACLCDPKPGEKLLDLCAGGGGKALALGSAMGGRGLVIAHDADARRLQDTRRRAKRAGLGNIRSVQDAESVRRLGPYDLVLTDVPCSSSGTLRRNPDVAWRWGELDLERLASLQREILDRGADLVRPGGHLVYATCSLFEKENTRQVDSFLANRADFRLAPPGSRRAHRPLLDIRGSETGAFRLPADLPRYDGDAFFLARFQREG